MGCGSIQSRIRARDVVESIQIAFVRMRCTRAVYGSRLSDSNDEKVNPEHREDHEASPAEERGTLSNCTVGDAWILLRGRESSPNPRMFGKCPSLLKEEAINVLSLLENL